MITSDKVIPITYSKENLERLALIEQAMNSAQRRLELGIWLLIADEAERALKKAEEEETYFRRKEIP
jgi:hypothetical protein